MPVGLAVENELELFVLRFFGCVTEQQILEVLGGMARGVDHVSDYRALLVFDPKTDLSELSRDALQNIRAETKAFYREQGLGRRTGAAVLDSSQDAQLILPLWNALSRSDPEFDLHYEIFDSIGPALAWLDVPEDRGLALVASAEAPTQ